MATAEKEGEAVAEGGEVLFCGGTSWDVMGRKSAGQVTGSLVSPTRLRTLVGVSIRFVASGCASCHCVALDVEGRCYTWGRNERGQLGHGDLIQRNMPTIVSELSKSKIVKTGAGRSHTVVMTEDGKSFSFGWNKHGQLGSGSTKNEIEPSPVPCLVSEVTNVVCGGDFTVWLTSVEGSSIMLGHREQKDEWVPRLVDVFQRHNVLPLNAVVSAGSASSACTAAGGQLYMWGKLKNSGDDWMYPKPVMDLSGWNIRCMDSGNMHHVCGADDSCISWGLSLYGELGYGPNGQKSSANPKKVDILEGMRVMRYEDVACGAGLSLIVVDRTNIADRLEQLEIYNGATSLEENENLENDNKLKKGAPKSPANRNKRKKTNDSSSDSEDGDESVDESEQDVSGESNELNKASRRGRGGGAKKTSAEANNSSGRSRGRPKSDKSEENKSSGKGRGRPRKAGAKPSSGRGRGRPRKNASS
ncbi:hypothetical protein QJS04_geneDACA015217 [Acorus gramineus]|uniref:Uncharacterized protein n=1 Tax=Acorus gramineus TaxID=55184 RepID=A0AAV9BD95_ACOGR|nr:hypothetical protein QJS04_geneDACA015217 [Acorus gramineus]